MPSRGSSVGKEGSYFSTDDDNIELPYGHFPAHNDRPPFHWQPSPGSPSPYMHPSGHDALQAYSPRWGPTSPQPPQKRKRPAISLETSTGANTTPLSFNSRWGRAKEEESPPAKRRHTESEQSEEASTEHQSHTPMPENESSADPAPEPMRLHSPPLVPPAEPQSPTAEPKSKTVKTQTESRLKMVLAGDAGGTLDPHKLLMGLYRAQQRATSSSSAKPPTGLDVSNEALASPPREVPIIAIVPATPKSEAPWALATCSSRSGAYRSDALLRPGQAERALMWRERSTRASERLKAAKALKEVGEAEDDTGEVEERQVVSGPSEEDVFRS